MPVEDPLLGRGEDPVEAAQHGERQDHLPVLAPLVVAPQHVGDGPDKGGVVAGFAGRAHGRKSMIGAPRRTAGVILLHKPSKPPNMDVPVHLLEARMIPAGPPETSAVGADGMYRSVTPVTTGARKRR